MDIHNYKGRLARTLDRIKTSTAISKENKEIIIRFHDSCFADGLSICKTERYIYDLFRLSQILNKDLDTATREDLQSVAAEIEKREWTASSKQTFKVLMKKFYKWIEGTDEYPDKIKWMKTNIKSSHKKLPDELFNEEDIEKLIRFAETIRDKAFISVLYESGCRIGEIGEMKIKDIWFDTFGARIHVSGKTGARIVRVVNSAPYLQEWINSHPYNQDSNSSFWRL